MRNSLYSLSTLEQLLQALGIEETERFPCPVHIGRQKNVSVKRYDRFFVVKCWSHGCSQEAIVTAVLGKKEWKTERLSLPLIRGPTRPKLFYSRATPLATYDYRDANGNLLFQKLRFATHRDGKRLRYKKGERWIDCPKFRIRQLIEGVWYDGKPNVHVLYQLPLVLKASFVFCVEGEKDCDTLNLELSRFQFTEWIATTTSEGATGLADKKTRWRPDYTQTLQGKRVILIPDEDADQQGQLHAQKVQHLLQKADLPTTICRLPNAAQIDGYDLSDFLATHSFLEWFATFPIP